jgi:hypothetical protein
MSLGELVQQEFRNGLARMEGTRAVLVVPIRQRVIDDLLPLVPGVPPNVAVALGADRDLQVRYGSFHASARVRPQAALTPAPIVTFELASQLVAFALRRLPLPPFVRLSGRDVHVHLADIPALSELAGVWPHVEHIGFQPLAGGLQIVIHLVIKSGGTPLPWPGRTTDRSVAARRTPAPSPIGAWVQRQLAAGLPAFAGAGVSATVRAPVPLLNDLLAAALVDAARGKAPSEGTPAPARPDGTMMARLIRHVRVDTSPGVVTLDVEAGVDG